MPFKISRPPPASDRVLGRGDKVISGFGD